MHQAAEPLLRNPIIGMACFALAERPSIGCAAEQRDELAAFQLIDWHSLPPARDGLQDIEWAGVSGRPVILQPAGC
jgi:hypothetical protein